MALPQIILVIGYLLALIGAGVVLVRLLSRPMVESAGRRVDAPKVTANEDPASGRLERTIDHVINGWSLRVITVGLLGIGAVVGRRLIGASEALSESVVLPLVILVFDIVVLVIAAAAWVTWYQSKRFLARLADDVRREDSRAPVLLFRPFYEDHFSPGSAEEALASAVKKYGPLLALHEPGEKYAYPGAARLEAPTADWKNVVKQLMAESQAVIIVVTSVTEGFRWEIQEAVQTLSPEQLVLLLPFKLDPSMGKAVYDSFRQETGDAFPKPLPLTTKYAVFIGFTQSWEPITIYPTSLLKDPLTQCLEILFEKRFVMRRRNGRSKLLRLIRPRRRPPRQAKR